MHPHKSLSFKDSEITLKYQLILIQVTYFLQPLKIIGRQIEIKSIEIRKIIAEVRDTESYFKSLLDQIRFKTDAKRPSKLISIMNLISVEKNKYSLRIEDNFEILNVLKK
ncbi:UNKNOWN [Stylonychia lemnae]|uniref:Uncharacterized protein n=1 Tax=Stylonychia lemnae TaxID=5949 RepID=A0A078AJV0_STYLE|nr:UNKNOWN [Stylonychia lemnae]|eukprot:CDW82449.1 UNKNOWN [Stylonychia lemnae]